MNKYLLFLNFSFAFISGIYQTEKDLAECELIGFSVALKKNNDAVVETFFSSIKIKSDESMLDYNEVLYLLLQLAEIKIAKYKELKLKPDYSITKRRYLISFGLALFSGLGFKLLLYDHSNEYRYSSSSLDSEIFVSSLFVGLVSLGYFIGGTIDLFDNVYADFYYKIWQRGRDALITEQQKFIMLHQVV